MKGNKMDKEEVLELINLGFKPELIELEFGIPQEKIREYIDEQNNEKIKATQPEVKSKATTVETKKNKKKKTPIVKSPAKSQKQTRLDKIRIKYNETFSKEYRIEIETPNLPLPTQEDEETINKLIEKLKSQAQELENSSNSEKKQILVSILKDIQSAEKTPRTLDQEKQINSLLENAAFKNISFSREDKTKFKLAKAKQESDVSIARIIEFLASKTDDLQTLEQLQKQLPKILYTTNIYIDAIRGRLSNRITQIRTQTAINNIRNNIHPEIEEIIKDIANGTFNLSKAKKAISEEATRRVNAAPKSHFALTKEKQERQVMIQLRTVLSEKGEKYPIQDIEAAMQTLSSLSPEFNNGVILRIIVENLISQNKFEIAKQICNQSIQKRSFDTPESELSKSARSLKKQIVLSEIGSMIINQINNQDSTPEEDDAFMNLLEANLEKEKIKLSQIQLGQNQSGTKKIYLSDVWYTNPAKHK